MPTVRSGASLSWMWKIHSGLYRASGGLLGPRMAGWPLLLLTTTGRASGRPRTVALNFVPQSESFAVAASNAGDDRHPAWFLNLEAQPDAEVEFGRRRARVHGRRAHGPERDSLWRRFVERDPSYGEYQRRTQREIPVGVLEPVS